MRARPLPFLSVLSILLSSTAGLSASSAAASGAVRDAAVESALKPLNDMVRNVRSLHLHAKGVLQTIGGSASSTKGVGSVEYTYWGSGRNYRIAVSSAGRLPIAPDYEVAFNGRQFELFNVADSILSVRKDDSRSLPISLPNPFLLFLDHLGVVNDGCDGCMPRLDELGVKNLRLAVPGVAERKPTDEPGTLLVAIHGGTEDSTPFEHRLTFGKAGASSRLQRSRRVTTDGRLMSDIHYADFLKAGPNGEFELPTHLTLEVYDYEHDGGVAMHLEYFIDQLDVNQAIADGQFSLDWEKARSIWDSDSKMFIKGGKR